MSVTYKLHLFEGPLDLLLHLIDQAEIDVQDISISEITDQYMNFIHSMQELELEMTSEFVVMAATLLSMKSKQLLPPPPVMDGEEDAIDFEDIPDPRSELIRKLTEYRKYKHIAEHLRTCELERSLIYTKEPEDLSPYMATAPQLLVKGLHVTDLIQAFQKALQRSFRRTRVATIHRDEITVHTRIRQIVDMLCANTSNGRLMFSELLHEQVSRQQIVVTFLALLELMMRKQVQCYQHQLFDEIVIQWTDEVKTDGLSDVEVDY